MPIFTGGGVGRVALIADEPQELSFFNLARLIKRAGLQQEQFLLGVAEPGWRVELLHKGITAVMPLGEHALRAVLGESGIPRWRGRVAWNDVTGLWTIPTWKPSRLLHRKQPKRIDPTTGRQMRDPDIMLNPPRFSGQFVRDLHLALHVARHGFKRTPVTYLEDPSPEVFAAWIAEFKKAFAADRTLVLSFDIETPYRQKEKIEDELEERESESDFNTQILRISFAYRSNYAVTVPWDPRYLPLILALLEHKVDKLVWNGMQFDVPVIESNGHRVNGRVFDGMDAYHVLQSDLPKGLEAVSADATDLAPWKHLSDARPQFYSCVDADAALRNFFWTKKQLIELGMWESYVLDSVELMPILMEAGKRGNKLDVEKQKELKERFTRELEVVEAEIHMVVPEHLKPRKRYKKHPLRGDDDFDIAAAEILHTEEDGSIRKFLPVRVPDQVKVCTRCGTQGVTKGAHTAKKSLGKTLKSERHHPKKCPIGNVEDQSLPFEDALSRPGTCQCPKSWPKKEWEITSNPCHGAEIAVEVHPVQQWDEILPFNAGSSQQLMHYMRSYNHPIGVAKDDPDKETADRKHLEFLVKHHGEKHPLYRLALKRAKIAKALSTYMPEPDANGYIHTVYVNSTSTWRLGARKVKHGTQIQNWGKREGNPYATEAREQIIASPGHKLVQADSTSIEAVFLGWEMRDEMYIERANQSVHAWLAAMELGLEFTPENVEVIKKKHKNLYNQMKVANHMTNYGGSAYVLWQTFPEYFPTKEDAERVQNRIFALLPQLEDLHYHLRYTAQKQGFLHSIWGHRHYFFDVFTQKKDRWGNLEYTPSGRPKLKLGKDGKRAVAYRPQHGAGIFMRRNLLMMSQTKWRQFMPANVSIHDGYVLDVPEGLVSEAVEYLATLLTRPIPEMGGLRVGCEVEVGFNWGDYHETKNLNGMRPVKKVVIEEQHIEWNLLQQKAA